MTKRESERKIEMDQTSALFVRFERHRKSESVRERVCVCVRERERERESRLAISARQNNTRCRV